MEEGAGLTGSAERGGAEGGRGGVAGKRCSALCLPSPPGWRGPGVGAGFQPGHGVSSRAAAPGSFPIRVLRPRPGCRARSEGGTAERLWGYPRKGTITVGGGRALGT